MTRRRGFTIVEVMLATTMTVVLIGVTTVLYAYTMSRLGHCLSLYATQRETENAIDPIERTMRLAQSCSLTAVNGNSCLVCKMPQTCTDTNGDSIFDQCTPILIGRRGYERYGTGMRVWFYRSDASRLPGSAGSNLTMAQVSGSDSTPVASNVVTTFGYYAGSSVSMFDLVTNFKITVPSQTRSTTITVTSSSLTRNNNAASSGAATASERVNALSRRAYWRNWRP